MEPIFVFGSNLKGIHGAGAALHARRHHGAQRGEGVGHWGQSYALPTKDEYLKTLPLSVIRAHVQVFLTYAANHPELRFRVTRIGCGLAGYADADIAPFFIGAPTNCLLPEDWPQPAGRTTPSYAGIGSRATPGDVLEILTGIAQRLGRTGWTLRSGAADGADAAFERGARCVGGKTEIFLPWSRFNRNEGIDASRLPGHDAAMLLAAQFHPAWGALKPTVRKLMARNAHQVLGAALDDPVRMVVCWAPGSAWDSDRIVDVNGGTGLAVRLASERGIEIVNLAESAHRQRIERWLDTA